MYPIWFYTGDLLIVQEYAVILYTPAQILYFAMPFVQQSDSILFEGLGKLISISKYAVHMHLCLQIGSIYDSLRFLISSDFLPLKSTFHMYLQLNFISLFNDHENDLFHGCGHGLASFLFNDHENDFFHGCGHGHASFGS